MAHSAYSFPDPDPPSNRIVFVLPSFATGGAERVCLNLARDLAQNRGQECHLVVFDHRGPLQSMLTPAIKVHDLAAPRLRQGLVRLGRTLRSLKPDAVFSTMLHLNLAVLALERFLPIETAILVREANLPSLSLKRLRWPFLWRAAMKRLYPLADVVIASSDRMAEELASLAQVAPENLKVLANPVDEEALRDGADLPERSPGIGRRFVAAGRLVNQKGFDLLIDIAGDLPPEDEIVIFGDGPDRNALEQQIIASGARVSLGGYASDLPAWLAGADGFLMPSRFEGLPNTALEALACGTLVIASPQSGGIAEIAAEAPAGAVRIAEPGHEFLSAMLAIDPSPLPQRPRESLLPQKYQRETACNTFFAAVETAIATRRSAAEAE